MIPPYLLALAIGQLESRELSTRCGGTGEGCAFPTLTCI